MRNRIQPSSYLTLLARSIHNYLSGHVSKAALVTTLLPLSFTSLFGALGAAALVLPSGYDWRIHVISTLTSPHDNPEGYWLPSIGIMAAMLLALPFAGYLAQRLRGITPRLARSAGLGFALSFVLMLLAVAVQLAQPVIGLRWLHEFLARAAAGGFMVGMLCCCGCALKDRLRGFGGRGLLPAALTFSWLSLLLLLVACLASIGGLILLGQQAGQTWAEDFRQSFRHTLLWQLAFWEWVGAVVAFAFLTGSALLLPASDWERSKIPGRTSTPAEANRDWGGAVIVSLHTEKSARCTTRARSFMLLLLLLISVAHPAVCPVNPERSANKKHTI